MTPAAEVFDRRQRALVAALAFIMRSDPQDKSYRDFCIKADKTYPLTVEIAVERLREVLSLPAEAPLDEVLARAVAEGVMNAEEAARWPGYVAQPQLNLRENVSAEALAFLRAFVVDARSLDVGLRGR